MRIKSFILERYRAFKERQRIELSPVTVVIGKNGSGKSVLSRLPLLLSRSLSDSPDGPVDLSAGGIEHAGAFADLIHDRSALPFLLGVEIGEDDKTLGFETTLQYVNEKRWLAISRFRLWNESGDLLELNLANDEDLTSPAPTYGVSGPGLDEKLVQPEFKGLFPRNCRPDDVASTLLAESLESFRRALPMPSYLGPFRVEPSQLMRVPNQVIRDLGPRGERALEFLADDRLRHGGHIERDVREWFGTAMDGQAVEIDVSGDPPKVQVSSRRNSVRVSLSDTGAGFAQVLPVAVQHFAYRAGRLPTSMLIVEQPELHLHPAAHGAVADLILGTATPGRAHPPALCIVETHSEQFIMRLRRRVAELSDGSAVTLLSLGHRDSYDPDIGEEALRVIHLDDEGNPETWPVGVFEETLVDLIELRRANRDGDQ